MSLIEEILKAALDSNVDLPSLLRKCKLLAARINNNELAQWVDHELNGYPTTDGLPSYRVLRVQSFGDFYGPFGKGIKNAPIPEGSIPAEYRDYATTEYLLEGVSELAALAASDPPSPIIQFRWNPDLFVRVGSNIYPNLNCFSAWKSFSKSAIVGILDIVHNKVLDLTIKIEAELPDATDPASLTAISQERSQQIFQMVILGDVANLAYGSSEVTQDAEVHVSRGDFSSLRELLIGLGVSEEEIDELKVALKEDDQSEERGSLGSRTSQWIGNMIAKTVSGTWDASTSVAADVLKKAILSFLGLE